MNVSSLGRTKWRKKNSNIRIQPLISILIIFFILFFFVFYTDIPKYISSSSSSSSQFPPQCQIGQTLGEKYLWFAPHSGFSNQLSELKNAILIAGILNRTLIVPPILDHHAVVLGSCPKFRVLEPNDLRIRVWDHIIQLTKDHRYVSMADIVDLSSLESMIRTIDFRVFTGLWCSLNKNLACIKTSELESSSLKQCGSLISGMDGNVGKCLYALKDDCRNSVWTYQQKNGDGVLDSLQPDDQLKKKKKISYVRRRRDVLKAFGPNTEAGLATVLAFGSLFTSQYKGSELYIDIHEEDPLDNRIQSLIKKIKYLPFVPEIRNAGKKFVVEKIKSPFLCAQLRLLDGQFKNHWKTTFLGLQQKLEILRNEGSHHPIHIFIMTDLPEANWTGSYLEELARDSDAYKLFSLREGDELVVQTAKNVAVANHGLKSGFSPKNPRASKMKKNCASGTLPSILLYLEESVCSCASLGFVGTAGSTIAETIEIMRKNGICLKQDKIE